MDRISSLRRKVAARSIVALSLWFSIAGSMSAESPPRAASSELGAAAEYVIVELGSLGTGRSEARSLNNAGEVVGYSLTGEVSPEGQSVRRAFLWLPSPAYHLPAGLHDLGTLRTHPLGSSDAFDISDTGQIVGRSEIDELSILEEPAWVGFSWRAGSLDALPAPAAEPFFHTATSVNALGEMAFTDSLGFGCLALLWLPAANYGLAAGFHSLPPLAGLLEGTADAINGKGQIVGWRTGACDALGAGSRAFLWLPEPDYGLAAGMQDLTPNVGEGADAFALAINDAGQVVGEIDEFPQPRSGFLWDQGVMTDLAFRASGINEQGWVVGDSADGPVLWRNGQLDVLSDLVAPGSGWQLLRAVDINDRGQIAAIGSQSGQTRALLLDTVLIFASGFESGDFASWDAVFP